MNRKNINAIISEVMNKYINEAKTYSLDDDVAWYIVNLAMTGNSPMEIQNELQREGYSVSIDAIEDLINQKSPNQSYQNDDEYNKENLIADTGSGRRDMVTNEQNLAYLKVDILNDYFEQHPFCIWAIQFKGKGADRKVLDARLPVQVILRANFDSENNPKNGRVGIRVTEDPKSEISDILRNKANSNILWKYVRRSKDKKRDKPEEFSLDKGPAEIMDNILNSKDYDLIKMGEMTKDEYANYVSQENDRLMQRQYGAKVESKNEKNMFKLTEKQIIDMVNEAVNRLKRR